MAKQTLVKSIFLFVGLLLFFGFVWPTPYVITKEGKMFMRINRFTGIREMETDNGWMTNKEIAEEQSAKSKIVEAEFKLVSSQITIVDDNTFGTVTVNNPTDWSVKPTLDHDVTVDYYLVGKDGNQTLLGTDKQDLPGFEAHSDTSVLLAFTPKPKPILNLEPGTTFVQDIKIKFDQVQTDHYKKEATLSDPLMLQMSRTFVMSIR